MSRMCPLCKVEKDSEEGFYRDKNRVNGRAYMCKDCMKRHVKRWSQTTKGKERQRIAKRKYNYSPHGRAKRLEIANRPKHLERAQKQRQRWRTNIETRFAEFDQSLRRNYGIDAEDWARMFNAQQEVCAGCHRPLHFDRRTHVDHCHATGVVRGLLCNRCNYILGVAKDRPGTLRRLANYLELRRC